MTTPRSDDGKLEGREDDGLRPFYAVAGLTDVVARTVRERVRSGRVMAAERWTQMREQARTHRSDLPRIDLSRIDLSDLQHKTRATYASLAVRGKHAVDDARDFAREFGDQYGGRLRGTIAAPLGRATDFARPMADKLFKQERTEAQSGDHVPTGQQLITEPKAETPTFVPPTVEPVVETPVAETPVVETPVAETPTAGKADDDKPTEA